MFLKLIDGKKYVDHIDTNPLNNNVENLRFITMKENLNNPLSKEKRTGKNNSQYGKTGGDSKSSIAIVGINIKNNKIIKFDGLRDAEQKGFNHSGISRCLNKKQKIYKNYKWYYLEDYLNMVTLSEANTEMIGTCND